MRKLRQGSGECRRIEAAQLGTSLTVAVAEGLDLRSGPGTTFPVVRLLPAGTLVEPIEREGRWLSVSVLNAQGQPSQTGWVHEHYLS